MLDWNSTGISQRFIEELRAYVINQMSIQQVILYGSRARGDYNRTSDIDLAIRTNYASRRQQNLMEQHIQEMSTPLKIDIVYLDRLSKKSFILNMIQDGVTIYEQQETVQLDDYKHASKKLDEATRLQIDYDIIYDAVIQRFEFTFELSWKLMKAFLEYKGINEIRSPRDTIRESFAYGLIENGEQWIDMMVDRNKMSHLYDEAEAKLIYEKVKSDYSLLLSELANRMETEIESNM